MTAAPHTWRRARASLPFIGALALLALLASPDAPDAKRKKRSPPVPLKIMRVTPSPVPFIPGPGSSLALAVTVELPDSLDGADILEVSSLISFPSKRSIRFLFDRQSLDDVVVKDGKPRKRVTLLWDGKDQYRRYVSAGTYAYAIRAKLMAEAKGFVQTKTVSLFERGTLDVSSPPPSADATAVAPVNSPATASADTMTDAPANVPTDTPTDTPTDIPADASTVVTTNTPADASTFVTADTPADTPPDTPANAPADASTATPTDTPANAPTDIPTAAPTVAPPDTPPDVPLHESVPSVDAGVAPRTTGEARQNAAGSSHDPDDVT